jgi:hypothetical protein
MYAQDIAPAMVDEVIDIIARKVVEARMDAPATLALESMGKRAVEFSRIEGLAEISDQSE